MANIKEKIEKGHIHAVIIIEILGRPPEYVEESLNKIIETIGKESGVEIINKKIYPPKAVEKQEDLFSSFSEIELLAENFKKLLDIIFTYLPSSIEVIAPEEMRIKLNDVNAFVNDLTARLHRYDALAKTMIMQNAAMKSQFQKLMQQQQQKPEEVSEKKEEIPEEGKENKKKTKKSKKK